MKIVITGTTGLVGYDAWHVLKEKHEVWGVGRRKPEFIPFQRWRTLDLVDVEETAQAVQQINPDCVVHLAALSNPDDCERDPVTAYKANALGTRNLALACQRFDTELMVISSDQVFNGKKKAPYTELDAPDPVNVYGRSKVWAERFTETLLRRFYVVRTALIHGPARPTFVDRVARALQTGEPLIAATDIVNSPTYSKDLAKALELLAESHLYGTYHIVNEGACSRWELAQFIAEAMGVKPKRFRKGTQKGLKLLARRPGYSPMENLVWNLNGFPRMRSWQDALLDYLQDRPDE